MVEIGLKTSRKRLEENKLNAKRHRVGRRFEGEEWEERLKHTLSKQRK